MITDTFEEQEMKKIRLIIRDSFDKSVKRNMMRNKPKVIIGKLKDKTFRDIWTLFETREEEKERKELEKKKEHNERLSRIE